MMKEELWYTPDCQFYRKTGIIHSINYYLDHIDAFDIPCYRKDVFFAPEIISKTGKQSGSYWYQANDLRQPALELLKPYNCDLTLREIAQSKDLILYECAYSQEWINKHGLMRTAFLPSDGKRTRLEQYFSQAFTLSTGVVQQSLYFTYDYQKTFSNSGNRVTKSANKFGGISHVDTLLKTDYLYRARGIESQVLDYDKSGILRQTELSGKSISDSYGIIGLITGLGIRFQQFIANYDASGTLISQDIELDPNSNSYQLQHARMDYLADGGMNLKCSYSTKGLNASYPSTHPLEIRYDRNGWVWYIRSLAHEADYDTIETDNGKSSAVKLTNLIDPLKVKDQQINFKADQRTVFLKNGIKIKETAKQKENSIPVLAAVKFRSQTIPLYDRLNEPRLAEAFRAFCTSDLEKAWAVYCWMATAMYYYDFRKEINGEDFPMLLSARGVCNDYSSTYYSIASKIGLWVADIHGIVNSDTPEGHAWNAVRLDNQYFVLDPTWNIFLQKPVDFMDSHWPEDGLLQFGPVPYLSYNDYKIKTKRKTGALDAYIKRFDKDTLVNQSYCLIDANAEVLWKGKYYPVTVQALQGFKYFVHYVGYPDTWDEWVTVDRIKDWHPTIFDHE